MVNVLVVKDHLRLAYDICNSARVKEVVDEFVVCACVCVSLYSHVHAFAGSCGESVL